jgi:hypothetical protein
LFENPKFNPGQAVDEGSNNPGLQSKFLIETARNVYAGSSYTIMRLHISELAKWANPEETMISLMQAVPDRGAVVVVESTANGLNYFYELWQKAEKGDNNFVTLFIPWYEHADYRVDFAFDKEKLRFDSHLEEFSRDEGIDYREMMYAYKLELEQVAWYRQTLRDKCGSDLNKMHQEYPSCPEEAFISSGSPVFNAQKVLNRRKVLEDLYKSNPPLVGNITYTDNGDGDPIKGSHKFSKDTNGWLTVYEMPKPGTPYVIGGDIAEGGIDYSVGQVIDNSTGAQVAVWRAHTDTDLYAKQMYALGYFYNEALIAIEMNFDSHPIKELDRLKYYRQYKREVIDTITKRKQHKHGWRTTSASRPVAIGKLVEIVRDEVELINDMNTLNEMLTFIRDENGRPEAEQGKHDDCVLALAIAHKVRDQQKTEAPKAKEGIGGEVWHYEELRMNGYTDSQIRKISKTVKVLGGKKKKGGR